MRRRLLARLSARLPKGARLAALLGVAVISGGTGAVLFATDALRELELQTVDFRFEVRGKGDAPKDVAVVAIDAATFQRLGLQFPFPRSVHARMIDRLRRDGARAIVYDVQFTEKARDPAEDNALILAARRAGNVVLASTEVNEFGETAVFGGPDVQRLAHAEVANSSLPVDPGGVLRRFTRSVDGLESLALTSAERATGRVVAHFPGGDDGAWIDYSGPPGTVPTYSFASVLSGRVAASRLRGKIVVVGASAPTLQDVHPTPTTGAELMAGPEVHANAIQTVLRHFPLRESGNGWSLALIVMMALLSPVLSVRANPVGAFLAAITVGALFALGSVLAFGAGTIVSFVYPLSTLGISAVGMLAIQYAFAALDRQRIRSVFARFVPEPVVSELIDSLEGEPRLGGVVRDTTILFCDIRGFTGYSERHSASEVIDVLNRYLTTMSKAILDHGGTLVAFLGDGILAVFGAPLEDERHADQALAATRAMLAGLEEFNVWLVSETGGEPFSIGIGLNSGEVISGNVGSEQRLEYTTIGDVVNTASRIEGLTKGTAHTVLLAESTLERMTVRPGDLIYVDEVEIRGREAKVKVWSIEEDTGF